MTRNHHHISEMLCAILEAHNFNIPQLAKKANIPYSTLYAWVTGYATPNYHSIVKLCKSINLDPQFFKP